MKNSILALAAVACISASGSASSAATFTGYNETEGALYSDIATFDYDPVFLGGSIFDISGLVDISLSKDLGSGNLLLTDNIFLTVLDGFLLNTSVSVDNGVEDDSFSMLFDLTTGSTDYAIATFTGDLDGLGFTDFFNDGVLFGEGTLKIVGATQDSAAVVPLPAGLPLLLTGFGGFVLLRRKGRSKKVGE